MNLETQHSFNGVSIRIGTGKKLSFFTTTWKSNSSNAEVSRQESFWHVRSSSTMEATVKLLRNLYFWKEIEFTPEFLDLCFSNNAFLRDIEFNVLLALLAETELSREEIAIRSKRALEILGKKSNFDKNDFFRRKHSMYILAELERRAIRPSKKYSGWVRNSSSVGSKRKSKIFIPEPLLGEYSEEMFDEYKILYELISVGKIETKAGFIKLS